MPHRHLLKATLKRGAVIAAANWPVTLVQAVADSLFKLLLAAPIIGGIFLVALVLGTAPDALFSLEWRDMAATILSALLSHPVVLASFLGAVAVVGIGGSLFVYLVKGGTVGVLVRSEREVDAIEDLPLHVDRLARASRFSADFFIASARALFTRFASLGLLLIAVYLLSAAAYFVALLRAGDAGWALTAVLTVLFVAWITVVNLLYVLVQIVIAADDCGVATAARRVAAFLRQDGRSVGRVFGVVLAVALAATFASFAAAALLGLIAFVPFVGLAILPIQLLAWLLRELVFQYIGLASIGAYLTLYRRFAGDYADGRFHDRLSGVSLSHGATAP